MNNTTASIASLKVFSILIHRGYSADVADSMLKKIGAAPKAETAPNFGPKRIDGNKRRAIRDPKECEIVEKVNQLLDIIDY
jgi:hypothetical protein